MVAMEREGPGQPEGPEGHRECSVPTTHRVRCQPVGLGGPLVQGARGLWDQSPAVRAMA